MFVPNVSKAKFVNDEFAMRVFFVMILITTAIIATVVGLVSKKRAVKALTPLQEMSEPQHNKAHEDNNEYHKSGEFCHPCVGPSIGLDGSFRIGPSFSPGIGL